MGNAIPIPPPSIQPLVEPKLGGSDIILKSNDIIPLIEKITKLLNLNNTERQLAKKQLIEIQELLKKDIDANGPIVVCQENELVGNILEYLLNLLISGQKLGGQKRGGQKLGSQKRGGQKRGGQKRGGDTSLNWINIPSQIQKIENILNLSDKDIQESKYRLNMIQALLKMIIDKNGPMRVCRQNELVGDIIEYLTNSKICELIDNAENTGKFEPMLEIFTRNYYPSKR